MSPSSPDPLLVASQSPHPHRVVPGGGGDGKPSRGNRDLRDPVLVASEVAEVGAGDVPHVDGRVVAGGEHQPPRHGHAHTGEAGVRGGRLVLTHLLIAPNVPQSHLKWS